MQKEAFIRCVPGWYRCFFKLFYPNGDDMSTGQMDNKTYDVIFVARKNAENKNAE